MSPKSASKQGHLLCIHIAKIFLLEMDLELSGVCKDKWSHYIPDILISGGYSSMPVHTAME